jgi:hypothetical protein
MMELAHDVLGDVLTRSEEDVAQHLDRNGQGEHLGSTENLSPCQYRAETTSREWTNTYITQLGNDRIGQDSGNVADDSRNAHGRMLFECAGGIRLVYLPGIIGEGDNERGQEETAE